MPKTTLGPSAIPPGGVPTGSVSGTGLCCACPASGTVSKNGNGNYFRSGYAMSGNITNKCSIAFVRTATGGTVTISKTFSLSYVAGATARAHQSSITNAITTAMSNWTSGASSHKLQIQQPGCRTQKLRIVFTSTIASSGANVSVRVDNTTPTAATGNLRSFVRGGTQMTFYVQGIGTTGWTMTHEIGHTFGLPDEYISLPGVPITPPPTTAGAAMVTPPVATPTMTYIGSPPQANSAVVLTSNFIDPSNPMNYYFDNAGIMGQNGNTTYPANNFYWIAIEVKRIMAAAGTPANVSIV